MKQVGRVYKIDYPEGEFVSNIPEIREKGDTLVEKLKEEGWEVQRIPVKGRIFQKYYISKKGNDYLGGIIDGDKVYVYDNDLEKFISEYKA